MNKKRLKILTWNIHGNYLYYLTQCNYDFYLPVRSDRTDGYIGKTANFPWGENVHEIPVNEVRNTNFDSILFQSKNNFLIDRYTILSDTQQKLPGIYLEHDPPREHPTETLHTIDDPNMTLVHVSHFNKLMWNSGRTPTVVIEHGIKLPENAGYKGSHNKGVVVINNLPIRGRRLGLDIFQEVRKYIPIDLIGMGSEELGGLGEIPYKDLPDLLANYRFFFSPIRYTSLALSICEAMTIGMPIIGLGTTELATVIQNDFSGYIHTNLDFLIQKMKFLLNHPSKARTLGNNGRNVAIKRFNINRFTRDWEETFERTINSHPDQSEKSHATRFFASQ